MKITDSVLNHYLKRFNKQHMRLYPSDKRLPEPVSGKRYLLYIHIPFCESLCPFCSFHRVEHHAERTRKYFSALRKEILAYHHAGFDFIDIYVGGGTPTVAPEELTQTLKLATKLWDISGISVETNPNHLQQPILDLLLDAGVTRLSVGVQSLDNHLLQEMGRYDTYGSAGKTLDHLRLTQGQFKTFNVDMIFNLPHQTIDSLNNDLKLLSALEIDQISYYPLMPSSTTKLAMSRQMGNVDFENERCMYDIIRASLMPEYKAGTAWSFSHKNAAIDEYIVDHDEYLGLGSGAFSFLNGTTYSTTFSINHYLDRMERGQSAITSSRSMSTMEQLQYDFLMKLFGLRMDKAGMTRKHGPVWRRRLWKEFMLFKFLGAIQEYPEEICLTPEGMYYWVIMMRDFFIGVNDFRTQMRARIRSESEIPIHLD